LLTEAELLEQLVQLRLLAGADGGSDSGSTWGNDLGAR